MKLSDVMGAAGLASWAEIALILSFITFAAIVVYVFVIRSRASFEDARNLPLEEGCQVRSSAVAGTAKGPAPSSVKNGNCGTADLAPPETSS